MKNIIKNVETNQIKGVFSMCQKYIYKIYVRTYYYSGSYNDQGNYYLKKSDYDGNVCVLTFSDLESAESYLLSEFKDLNVYLFDGKKHIYHTDYRLDHSEYSCCDFQIRKFKI